MIEAIVKATESMAKTEVFQEITSNSSDVIPKVFDELPKADRDSNIDAPVSTKRIDGDDFKGTINLITRNEGLEGDVHPITGVPFERKIIETPVKMEGVFPKFDSAFDAKIPEDLYTESDKKQFRACNQQLKEEVNNNPELAPQFDKSQLEQIENGDVPDGYVWHHDVTPGKIQLVNFETHANTGHTGGRAVWGGGNDNR